MILGVLFFLYYTFWFGVCYSRKRLDVADLAWGLGFPFVSWLFYALYAPSSSVGLMMSLLITLWGLRLFFLLLLRRRGKGEDFRYIEMREKWKSYIWLQAYLKVFLLQGAILLVIVAPALLIQLYPEKISLLFVKLAFPFWLTGFMYELVSDYQLYQYQKKGEKTLLKTGLWKLSRHPNYLGEVLQWWAIWFVSSSLPFGLFMIVSPLLLTFLILKVSGAVLLEKRLMQKEGYAAYKEKTPLFFPHEVLQSLVYAVHWILAVYFGSKGENGIVVSSLILSAFFLFFILRLHSRMLFSISLPLALYAFILGGLGESFLVSFGFLIYPGSLVFPPYWLWTLYPLFSTMLNTSLYFLNYHLGISFVLGALGSAFVYRFGEELGAVSIPGLISYIPLMVVWGFVLVLLIILNRSLQEKAFHLEKTQGKLFTVFDGACPICFREMKNLKKRKQIKEVVYLAPKSEKEFLAFKAPFSYREAMRSIHVYNEQGYVYRGIDALSEIYARVDLFSLALFLRAPLIHFVMKIFYWVWARVRPGKVL